MNVSLTPELEGFVQAKIQSGRYASAGEVIVEALLLLKEHDAGRAQQVRELRDRIDTGLGSLSNSEGAEGESFMQNLLETVHRPEDKRKAG